jgi:hypothetical protein
MPAAAAAVLLGAAPASRAQEEPKPAAPRPEPAPAKSPAAAVKSAAPAAKAATSPAKRTLSARPGAGAPHTNVETTEGLEKRAAANGKPAAVTASPAEAPK